MKFLFEIWPWVEKIGIPILAGVAILTFGSLNFYWRTISELKRLEKYIIQKQTTKGFKSKTLPLVGPLDIIFGFLPISKFDKRLSEYQIGLEHINSIKMFRKNYRILFPLVIGLATIGITINELIIDK